MPYGTRKRHPETFRRQGSPNSRGWESGLAFFQGLLKQGFSPGASLGVCPQEAFLRFSGVRWWGECGLPFHSYFPHRSRSGVREGFWLDCDKNCSSLTRKMHSHTFLHIISSLPSISENTLQITRVKQLRFRCLPKCDTYSTDGAPDFRGWEDEHL